MDLTHIQKVAQEWKNSTHYYKLTNLTSSISFFVKDFFTLLCRKDCSFTLHILHYHHLGNFPWDLSSLETLSSTKLKVLCSNDFSFIYSLRDSTYGAFFFPFFVPMSTCSFLSTWKNKYIYLYFSCVCLSHSRYIILVLEIKIKA